jgi:hypothetical protein
MRRVVWTSVGWLAFVLGLLWMGGNDPRVAFANFADLGDTPSVGHIEIGSSYGPWKRSSLSLICTPAQTYKFVLKTRLFPHDRPYIDKLAPITNSDRTRIFVGREREVDRPLEVLFKVQRVGVIDTLVSSNIGFDQLRHLASVSGSDPPEAVSVHLRVYSVYMSGTATAADLDAFQQGCRERARSRDVPKI